MDYEVGDFVLGKVAKVRPYAIFLDFDDDTHGLLHISEISDRYIRDIEKFATIGDEIKVKVLEIDDNNGFMRVSYKKVPDEDKYCSHDSSIKSIPQGNEGDFSALQAKLPEWIEETLKKARKNKDD